MWNVLQLAIRIIMFALAFYFILEYVVVCDIATYIGVIAVIGTIIFVIAIFMLVRGGNVRKCQECGQNICLHPVEKLTSAFLKKVNFN